MEPLPHGDAIHLTAAKGWCELQNFAEAQEELAKITASLLVHPDVLEIRWQICANTKKWDEALEIATAIVAATPGKPNGWIYRANSLNELGRVEESYAIALEAAQRFPKDEIILYDLACYCCALKRLDEARAWLRKAIEFGGARIKLKALDDPDLEPLWV